MNLGRKGLGGILVLVLALVILGATSNSQPSSRQTQQPSQSPAVPKPVEPAPQPVQQAPVPAPIAPPPPAPVLQEPKAQQEARPKIEASNCRKGDVLNGVYNPTRLRVLALCMNVNGTVMEVRKEPDGDYHINVALDPSFVNLLNQENYARVKGWLVVEVIPSDLGSVKIPKVGERATFWGVWVTDTVHGWNELHPTWLIVTIATPSSQVRQQPVPIQVPVQPQPPLPQPASPPPAGKNASTLKLIIAVVVGKDPIVRGNIQTIIVNLTSSSDSLPVANVTISGTVFYASGSTTHRFAGLTDLSGRYSYSWPIGGNSTPGIFTIYITASKTGYSTAEKRITFQVVPAR